MENTIGTKIAALRKARGLTQEELAEKLGVSGQAVSKWENDISYPDIMMLPKLASLFGVTTDEFLISKAEEPEAILLPAEKRKNFEEMMLIIKIDDEEDRVRVNIPLLLVKVCLETGMAMPQVTRHMKGVENIDFSAIITLVEKGMLGKLMEIESGDGATISIYVE